MEFDSKVLAQVHAGVEPRHLISVAVEHQSWPAKKLTQTALLGLAPPRMIDARVDVRVEAVFTGIRQIPGGWRLVLHELDLHDGLDALEPVLPGNHQADGSTVLVGKRLPVHPKTEEGKRVHRFVHS